MWNKKCWANAITCVQINASYREQDNIGTKNKRKIVIKSFVIHVFIAIVLQRSIPQNFKWFCLLFCVGRGSYGQKLFEQFVDQHQSTRSLAHYVVALFAQRFKRHFMKLKKNKIKYYHTP